MGIEPKYFLTSKIVECECDLKIREKPKIQAEFCFWNKAFDTTLTCVQGLNNWESYFFAYLLFDNTLKIFETTKNQVNKLYIAYYFWMIWK